MARKQSYTEDEVLKALKFKNDCRVDSNRRQIYVLDADKLSPKGKAQLKNDLGNKSWGKIDFLTNFCRYHKAFVGEF